MTRFMRAVAAGALALAVFSLPHPVWAADPEETHYNVVVSLYNAGQWEAAIKKIEEREKLDLPEAMRSKYLYARGLALERGGKNGEAHSAYEQVLAKYPQASEAQAARLAMLYLSYNAGKYDTVVAGYEAIDKAKLAAADKKNAALMYAESLYALKQDQATLAAYQQAIAAGADAAPLAGKLFDLYLRLGKPNELIGVSNKEIVGLPADSVAVARAEALLSLKRYAEVEPETKKVSTDSALYPRASFALAQALILQNKLKEAAAPLEIAVKGLRNPPAPPAAYLALAECYLEAGKAADVPAALVAAEKAIAGVPEAERSKFQGQIALLRLRAATPTGDRKAVIKAIGDSRASVPKDQLPKVLYLRLFALSEEKDHKAILQTMKDDLPVFQTSPELAPATLVYYAALQQSKRGEEAVKLLDDLLQRLPNAPETLKARLLLANAALEQGDFASARKQLEALLAAPKAAEILGKNTFDEAQFNLGVAAEKLKDLDAAGKALTALTAGKPAPELAQQAWPLLGQVRAAQQDYAGAAAAWTQALAAGNAEVEADLRDRLARALFAGKNYPGAIEQLEALGIQGGANKLGREAREIWARALFLSNRFEAAAGMYGSLFESFRDTPAYAYEAAVAWEREGKAAEAEKSYALASAAKSKLPADYAAAVDANLAAIRLKSGAGDMGAGRWLDQLAQAKDDKTFDIALGALRKVSAAGKLEGKSHEKLARMLKDLSPQEARRYALGSLLLESLVQAGRHAQAAELAADLAGAFAQNEPKLDPKSYGATLAPAMIHFYHGEALRQTRQYADALVAYETVLAAYPYNQWPDAAACGAAECFAALGDKQTAIKKFQEVALSKSTDPASAPWRELAQRRAAELEKNQGK